MGIHLNIMGYRENLRYYTFGQGGYFSPQQYFSASVPVSVTGRKNALFYDFNGYIGLQSFQENTSLYFPNNATFQSISGNTFPSQSTTGILLGVSLAAEYRATSNFTPGLRLKFDNSRNYKEFGINAYVKYWFGSRPKQHGFNISPLKGYNESEFY